MYACDGLTSHFPQSHLLTRFPAELFVIFVPAKRVIQRWSEADKNIIRKHLISLVERTRKPPKWQDVDKIIDRMNNRDWVKVKHRAWAMWQHIEDKCVEESERSTEYF